MPAPNGKASRGPSKPRWGKVTDFYVYDDEEGTPLFRNVRHADPKGFHQERYADGEWISGGMDNVRAIPFHLRRLIENPDAVVCVTEGEKDALALEHLGFVCTTNSGGASNWTAKHSAFLKGRKVAVILDADKAGIRRGEQIARSLQGISEWTKLITLPGLEYKPKHGPDVSDWLSMGHTAEELRELVGKTLPWGPQETDGQRQPDAASERNQRPTIVPSPNEKATVDAAIAALAKHSDVYQRAGSLVVIAPDTPPPVASLRTAGGPRIVPTPLPRVKELMAESANWCTVAGDDLKPCHPPDWCVRALDARSEYPGVRVLENVVESPTLRSDGTILSRRGFDAASGLFLHWPYPELEIENDPTEDAVHAARDALLDVVSDFPFADAVHRSTWFAAMVTLFCRHAYDGCSPLFVIDANCRGSGKTLLADTMSLIARGRPAPRMTFPRDAEELRKRITSLALTGENLVLLDNIDGRLGNATLDAALTATTWSDRPLGQTAIVTLPLSIVWVATANNALLSPDTARRSLHIRLETPIENPEERGDFRRPDLKAWIRENRRQLVRAALVVLRGYFNAGSPERELTTIGSFEQWARVVRQLVVWCGLPDPCSTREELASTADRDTEALKLFIAGWEEIDPRRQGETIADALKFLKSRPNEFDTLRSAILELVPPKRGDFPNSRSVSMRLHHMRRRVVGDKYLDSKRSNKGAKWAVFDSESFTNTPIVSLPPIGVHRAPVPAWSVFPRAGWRWHAANAAPFLKATPPRKGVPHEAHWHPHGP